MMKILLDTHVLIWFINGDDQLQRKSLELIQDINNECYVSIASIWEIAIKLSLGKLDIVGEFNSIVRILNDNDITLLPISFDHIKHLIILQKYHKDPFDRIIISQGIVEQLTIISKDDIFKLYKVKVLWD